MSRKNQPFVQQADLPWEPVAEGLTRKVLTYADDVMMVRVAFEAGAIGPEHSHPHRQISLIESGVFDITIAGRTARLVAGDSYLVPPDSVHGAVSIEAGIVVDVFTPMRAEFV